jgi:hypothetical protein
VKKDQAQRMDALKARAAKVVLLCLASVIAIAVLFLLFTPYRICMFLGLKEYLSLTQVLAIPLPLACSPSDQKPTLGTLALIGSQAAHYHLVLQSTAVCRMVTVQPLDESEFATAFFSLDVRRRWLPSYLGCCTYSFRRHFAVIVVENRDGGTIVVAANLVQNRREYLKFLRSHCDEKLRAWL